MGRVHFLHDEVAIVGWSCRLPGANSIPQLWSLLLEGRCAVSQVPADRFSLQRYGHPRRQERGKSYTWAAGVLDDIWGFDPSVFRISPREAEQMDPQQRILLQLTWEALEDAGIRPSSIAGTEVGVFVGASQTDYAHAVFGDQAIADSHFATGNALAILANRISYIYDLHGPSVTLDTACSSSLVALHQATEALRSGRIDTAIVGGINIIASPAEFISFSQASMLSPTGRCRAFSADADGYVRAEGGVVLILRKVTHASMNPVRGVIVASDINSDGRTNGISLPSGEAQKALLNRVYSRAGIDIDRLAFIEAHGTGTPVGDPIEATALGHSIGCARSELLPIGSVKTNIGHVEAASGLAGLVKALLALNHGVLPASLHFAEPNPKIEFERLKLKLCDAPLLLPNAAQSYAGVNSFGFGGTNAHVVVAPGKRQPEAISRSAVVGSNILLLSAANKPALIALAQKYSERIAHLSDQETAIVASAVAHRRDRLATRLVVSTAHRGQTATALDAFVAGSEHPHLVWGHVAGEDLPIAFVYSGNGSQWAGMGMSAYRHNTVFRDHFNNVSDLFGQIAGWSLTDMMFSEGLSDRLSRTSVAQPLIFSIQSALTAALQARGMRPSAVLGHSVGEVAAAEAAGILDLRTAVEVIYFRSRHQELVRGAGRMAAVLAAAAVVENMIEDVPNMEIAAFNSPRATTVAGCADSLARLKKIAKRRGIALLDLDLDYPFHTVMMTPAKAPLIADLKHITTNDGTIPFISTVTSSCLPGERLGASYWWHNIRRPVQFLNGIREAAKLGACFFVEIGPRSMLLKHVSDSLTGKVDNLIGVSVLDRNDEDLDPVDKVVSKALIGGAQIDTATIFGADPGAAISLPSYPWQQQALRYAPTPEAIGVVEPERRPFSGARYANDALDWHAHIDTVLFPALSDHKVGDQIIFPGTGFLEILLAVAREWSQTKQVLLADVEILKPLDLTNAETREVMSRVSPHCSSIEIFSRPRLSQASWLLHCRAKILHGGAPAVTPDLSEQSIRRCVSQEEIYRVADASGLHYGPAFRLLDRAVAYQGNLIKVELTPAENRTEFVLDPMRLDACCHGLLTVFPELRAEERGVSYLPVRLDRAALFTPVGVPHSAIIEVLNKNERSIVANYNFFGANGELLATLHGVRCQAVQVRRSSTLEANTFVELPQLLGGAIFGAGGLSTGAVAVIAEARARGLLSTASGPLDQADLLVEGWAAAVAYEIASALADGLVVNTDALVSSRRLPLELRPWFVSLLINLEAAGLAKEEDGQLVLIRDPLLPSAASVVKDLVREHPARAAEALIAGRFTGFAEQVLSDRAIVLASETILSPSVLDFYDVASVLLKDASSLVVRLIAPDALWPKDRAIQILQIGFGPLTQSLLALQGHRAFAVTVFEPDRRRFDLAQRALPKTGNFVLLGAEHADDLGQFDLVLAVESLHRLPENFGLTRLRDALVPSGLLMAVEPQPSLFRDIAFGLDPIWFGPVAQGHPVPHLRRTDTWPPTLESAGFEKAEAHTVTCGSGLASLIVAEAGRLSLPQRHAVACESKTKPHQCVRIFDPPGRLPFKVGTMLAELLGERGIASTVAHTMDFADPAPDVLIHILTQGDAHDGPMERLANRCLEIKACAERLGSARAKLWLVFFGALASSSSKVRPVATGAWAFSRTLANEFPHLDVRRVDVAQHVPERTAAARLADIIASDTKETELQIEGTTIRAVRVDTIRRTPDTTSYQIAPAVRLERQFMPGQRFCWQAIERTKPGPREVEIAVEATGLNFRDLMLMLSLLPDDIVEDGLTGPTLGCECAGRVTRVGSSVRHLGPGDRVVAVASSAFATHVTVSVAHVAKLPAGMSCAAGATIPVAFLTAYYSLVTQAKLKQGDWALIHGGAGGVGMAAIQIAQARGARIIATAGSQAKRDLLKTLGIHHVIDSRSTALTEDVRTITGSGVDVVLNSLAGDAMERSIACLRPFGRFVELGKRDYVANTHIGLRPFRKNLSYFGVDLDQLMLNQKDAGQKIFSALMRHFENGALAPLPYSVFRACDLSEACHLMQSSGHIGKIIVEPPTLDMARKSNKSLEINPVGTHVITGAFGGFGLEAAKWLVDRGARHLVLVGRRGAASDEAKAALADFAGQGVQVYAESCDVADLPAVKRLFEHVQATMPPVVGVVHAAMVLDDGLLSNLDRDRFYRVLSPKVKGAENLDVITRGLPLDYFVLFSSATTLMGNPGQGNYVAANAYMEGVARRRRQDGLKALAIGWGPITDVGVLARSERLRARFQKLTGVGGMRAREALDLMGQALEHPLAENLAVMTISPTEGIFNADRLQVLGSPTYAKLVNSDAGNVEHLTGQIDLQTIAKSEGLEGVRRKLTEIVVVQLARVLRARAEEISRVRPLGEIGLDSLMAIEFAMNLEESFGIHVSLTSAIGSLTVGSVVNEVMSQVDLDDTQPDTKLKTIAERHIDKVDSHQIAILEKIANSAHYTMKGLVA